MAKSTREIDTVTGVETTGHEWDGIKELDKPLPKWWLWTFYACCIWAFGYWIVYPAWPTLSGYTPGIWNYSQRHVVAREVEAGKAATKGVRDKIAAMPVADIAKSDDTARFAMAAGAAAFQANCAACHGRSATGFVGYPNLVDDEWIWGGTIGDIYTTILYGIRSEHKQTRLSQMPRYGIEKLLDEAKIGEVADYVLSLSGRAADAASVAAGAKTFAAQCADCHGADGKGKADRGAPNLTDPIWLYGSDREAILESIRTGRGGQMPLWVGRLDDVVIKSLAVYIHSRGGGK
ncbi:MAG TPA: cytochrome-c oxidase, cbb3-type subunit III [Hyphomicrobiaceae bacterium]|nr:cytochrome-c oxidase, cbb3-type subunit III [Hyphomicrobiaceae bacterium]